MLVDRWPSCPPGHFFWVPHLLTALVRHTDITVGNREAMKRTETAAKPRLQFLLASLSCPCNANSDISDSLM